MDTDPIPNSEETSPSIETPPVSGEADSSKPARETRTRTPPFFRRTIFYLALIPVAFLLGLGAGYLSWGREAVQAQSPSQVQVQTTEQAVQRYDVPEDDDPAIGPKNAPITIIEFSDYECPYCRRWYSQVYTQLRQAYPDKVRIVYRDYPLFSIHPNAGPAAEAANCAGEQDAYWEFHDKLFAGDGLSQDIYLNYASDLGLDIESFKSCVESGKYKDEVMADYEYASELGVRSTPTFFLNGLPIVGAHPFEVFQQVIEKELAGEIPK